MPQPSPYYLRSHHVFVRLDAPVRFRGTGAPGELEEFGSNYVRYVLSGINAPIIPPTTAGIIQLS